MDLINSWLNPSEIRLLAEKLLTPLSTVSGHKPLPEPPASILPTPEVIIEKEVVRIPTPEPQVIPINSSCIDDRLHERLNILREWALMTFSIKEMYLLDTNAELMFGRIVHQEAMSTAREFILYSNPSEILSHEISKKQSLQIFPASRSGESIFLCIVLTNPLNALQTGILFDLFAQSIS